MQYSPNVHTVLCNTVPGKNHHLALQYGLARPTVWSSTSRPTVWSCSLSLPFSSIPSSQPPQLCTHLPSFSSLISPVCIAPLPPITSQKLLSHCRNSILLLDLSNFGLPSPARTNVCHRRQASHANSHAPQCVSRPTFSRCHIVALTVPQSPSLPPSPPLNPPLSHLEISDPLLASLRVYTGQDADIVFDAALLAILRLLEHLRNTLRCLVLLHLQRNLALLHAITCFTCPTTRASVAHLGYRVAKNPTHARHMHTACTCK